MPTNVWQRPNQQWSKVIIWAASWPMVATLSRTKDVHGTTNASSSEAAGDLRNSPQWLRSSRINTREDSWKLIENTQANNKLINYKQNHEKKWTQVPTNTRVTRDSEKIWLWSPNLRWHCAACLFHPWPKERGLICIDTPRDWHTFIPRVYVPFYQSTPKMQPRAMET